MHPGLTIAMGVFVALAPPTLPAGQSSGELTVRIVRLYRADADRTRIKAFIEIPYAVLSSTPEATSGRQLAYKVGVTLIDSTGLKLLHQEWWGHGSAEFQQSGATAVEILDFAVAPGQYRLNVEVRDSVSGRSQEASTEVIGFDTAPHVSDLWLAPLMRLASASDTVPGPGELREGSTLITAAAQTVLTPLRSALYYLVEAYTDSQRIGMMHIVVSDSTGKSLVRSASVPVTVRAGGGILKGQMDLAGLPPGRYTMTMVLASGADSTSRSAEFVMQGLQETLERNVATRSALKITDEGYFAELEASRLDEAEAPLYYIAQGGELSVYRKDLSANAKRRFLTAFWAKRDPTPETPRNEARERFYEAIAYANRTFTEGGRKPVPGWKSDRGRIYARYGEPDDKLERQQEGTAPRYQVWRYTRERNRYYIFADRSGFGSYVLLATNDKRETGQANWMQLIGLNAVEDVQRFLGVTFLSQ